MPVNPAAKMRAYSLRFIVQTFRLDVRRQSRATGHGTRFEPWLPLCCRHCRMQTTGDTQASTTYGLPDAIMTIPPRHRLAVCVTNHYPPLRALQFEIRPAAVRDLVDATMEHDETGQSENSGD